MRRKNLYTKKGRRKREEMLITKFIKTHAPQRTNNSMETTDKNSSHQINIQHAAIGNKGDAFNKYLVNFTGFSIRKIVGLSNNNTSLIGEIKSKKCLEVEHLGRIFIALNKINFHEKERLKTYLFKKLTADIKKQERVMKAVETLGELGAGINDKDTQGKILALLKKGIRDKYNLVKATSYKSLGKLAANTKDVDMQREIFGLLEKGVDDWGKEYLYESLGKLGANSKDVGMQNEIFALLKKGIHDEDERVKATSYESLGKLAANSKDVGMQNEIFALLEKGIYDENEWVKESLYESLCKLAANSKDVGMQNEIFALLEKGIYDENEWVKESLYESLCKPAANTKDVGTQREIFGLLKKGIYDENGWVKLSSYESLGKLAANSKDVGMQNEIFALLKKGIHDKYKLVKESSYASLGKLGANSKDVGMQNEIFALLIEGTGNKDISVMKNSYNSLCKLKTDTDQQNEIFTRFGEDFSKGRDVNSIVKVLGILGVNTNDKNLINEILLLLQQGIGFNSKESIKALKHIAMKKGYLPTKETLKNQAGDDITDKEGNPVYKSIFTKALEEVKKNRREALNKLENPDEYTEALIMQKELEDKDVYIKFIWGASDKELGDKDGYFKYPLGFLPDNVKQDIKQKVEGV